MSSENHNTDILLKLQVDTISWEYIEKANYIEHYEQILFYCFC